MAIEFDSNNFYKLKMIISQIIFRSQSKFLMKFQKLSITLFSSLLLSLTVSSGIVLSPNLALAQDRDKTLMN
ncbi:hypothetical protein [Okeania sp. KiyG1]|uniref:hypothetical protein n=1 Tax=Okeania sp. KiyG1 TaxID=2720165 RepID=UPI001923D6CB|nr:hypothetical protein [Okeania sp. KiyG1]GGA40006.1 hypothetical protein CYANOKiyG1_58180 [Okeania sp. KiyG1]